MIRAALTGSLLLTLALSPAVRAEVSAETLKAISIPDKVETPIGTLNFFDGVPVGRNLQEGLRQSR